MPKKKVKSKVNRKSVVVRESSSVSPWLWYALGVLVLLAVLFFVFKGTGNAIAVTGNAVDTKNSFKPIVDMVSGLITNVYDALKPLLNVVVGDTTAGKGVLAKSEDIFIAKVLLLLLLTALVSAILSMVGGISFLKEGWSHWFVSIIVAILGVRFLNADLIQTILIPYSVFGVVLTAILPFVLYFLFVEKGMQAPNTPAIARKAAWILFGIVFLAIWVMRQGDFSKDDAGIISIIYPLTAIISFIMAFADGTIQSIFNKWGVVKTKAKANSTNRVHLNDMLNECNDKWTDANSRGNPDSYLARVAGSIGTDKGLRAYEKDLEELTRRINALT